MAGFNFLLKEARKKDHEKINPARFKEIFEILKKHHVSQGLTPESCVSLLEDLGTTFVKLGQIASNHPDMLPADYCEALGALRARVDPMPADVARAQVESELKHPIDELFSSFDDTPLGSASVAQVHKVTLKSDGSVVVLKIQRPGVMEEVTQDLAILEKIVHVAEHFGTGLGNLSIDDLLAELERTSREELDFTIEAGNLDRFYQNNHGREGVSSPRFFKDYSTERVLAEEYVDAPRVGQIEELALTDQERLDLANLVAHNYAQQLLEDGFFHADPHAGNILIQNVGERALDQDAAVAEGGDALVGDSDTQAPKAPADESDAASATSSGDEEQRPPLAIEWIDFGMMGTLNLHERNVLTDIVKSVVTQDAYKLKRAILQVVIPKAPVDHAALLELCEELLDEYGDIDLGSFDTGAFMTRMISDLQEYHFDIMPFLVMLGRGLVTLEGTVALISKQANVMKILSTYMSHLPSIEDIESEAKKLAGKALDDVEALAELPPKLVSTLDMLQKGQIKLDASMDIDTSFTSNLSHALNDFSLVVIAGSLFLGSAFLCSTSMLPQLFGVPALGFFGFVAGIVLMAYVVRRIFKSYKGR